MAQSPNREEAQSPRSTIAQSHFNINNYEDDTNYNTTTSSTLETLPRRGPHRLQSADMDIHQLRNENDTQYGENIELRAKVRRLEGQVSDFKARLSNADTHTEKYNIAFNKLETSYKQLQAFHTKLQATHKSEMDDLKHKHDSLAGAVSGTDKAKLRAETALAEAKRQLKMSEDRNSHLASQIAENPTITEKHFGVQAEELSIQMQGLQQDLTDLHTTIRNKDTQIKDLKAVNNKEKNEKRNMSRDISELKASKAKLLDSLKKTQAELVLSKARIPDGSINPEHIGDDDARSEMSYDRDLKPRQQLGRSIRSEFGGSTSSRDYSPTESAFGGSVQSDLNAKEGAEEAEADDETIRWTSKKVLVQEIDAHQGKTLERGIGEQTATGSNEANVSDRGGVHDGLSEDGNVWHVGRLPATQSSNHISDDGSRGQDRTGWVGKDLEIQVSAATRGGEHTIDNGIGGNDALFDLGIKRDMGRSAATLSGEATTGQTTNAPGEVDEMIENPREVDSWSGKKKLGVIALAIIAMIYIGLCYFHWTQANAAMQERTVWTRANMIGDYFYPYTQAEFQRRTLVAMRHLNKDALARAGWITPTKTLQYRPTMTFYVPAASAGPR